MKRENALGRHAIQSAFIFALIGLFALMSLLVIVLGTQAYRAVVDRSERNQRQRTAFSYIVNRVRASDATGAVAVEDADGLPVLTIRHSEYDDTYVTRFYIYEGMLTEQLSGAEDDFYPEDGESLIEAQALVLQQDGEGQIEFSITLADGKTLTSRLTPRSAAAEVNA